MVYHFVLASWSNRPGHSNSLFTGGERDEVPELRWSKWSGYSRRASDQSSDSESDHSSLESSSSIDLDNDNKECRLVFEPIATQRHQHLCPGR